MEGDVQLMQEMRRVKTGQGKLDELPETVDGVTGEDQVANKFADIFEALYNSSGSQEGMAELQVKIQGLVK